MQLERLEKWNPHEPAPVPVPALHPGTLCAPYDRDGRRVGSWVRLVACDAGCHLVARWETAVHLYGPYIHALVLWDGGARWCSVPMLGHPLVPDGADEVEVPIGPLYPDPFDEE
jgi:hypothetical protein